MKHLGHQGIGPNDTLPEHFGTNNRLNAEIQRLATRDSAEYLYNLEKQPVHSRTGARNIHNVGCQQGSVETTGI